MTTLGRCGVVERDEVAERDGPVFFWVRQGEWEGGEGEDDDGGRTVTGKMLKAERSSGGREGYGGS